MAVSGDITFAQDGGQGNAKIHPYLIALVRWCVSCVWSTATVLLHRLITAQRPQITGPKPTKPRPAGKDHLHPEPKVECQVLHVPENHEIDVIFVHGLYGSLENTWRQGDWRPKYKVLPNITSLRRPTELPKPNQCNNCSNNQIKSNNFKETTFIETEYDIELDDNVCGFCKANKNIEFNERVYDNLKKILPNDEVFTTENFYNNTLLNQVEIVDNYETQANFVKDLFNLKNNVNIETEENVCDNYKCDDVNEDSVEYDNKCKIDFNQAECVCKTKNKSCEIGCGCVCDDCYSNCWPRDWIKADFPEARVLSINYTSDPYLWRPLWVKGNKRLTLHERADQMIKLLLDLRVGEKPIIWVGHSKGGLFIKQIYCQAYDAYMKLNNDNNKTNDENNKMTTYFNEENQTIDYHNSTDSCGKLLGENFGSIDTSDYKDIASDYIEQHCISENIRDHCETSENNIKNIGKRKGLNVNVDMTNLTDYNCHSMDENDSSSTNKDENFQRLSYIWKNTAGVMYYSVPHRGSPLADIKTPITARSLELIEITNECPLVLSLQNRWLDAAASSPKIVVRSLVETCRTLMAILWLRIVSTNSADPGIGALCGVSVDHREICKPSSRQCPLYTELVNLIKAALDKCQCR